MATPTLTSHALLGALGPILVDVRSAARTEGRPAVILLPGFKGFKDWAFFPPLAERLARAGLAAVTVSVGGSGVDAAGEFTELDRFGHNTYSAELEDLRTVLTALASGQLGAAPPRSVGLFGHSRGGGVAVLHTARDPRIRGLVTWGAISSVDRWNAATKEDWRSRGRIDVVNSRTQQVLPLYMDVLEEVEQQGEGRLNIIGAASSISVPWLLLHGEDDETVEPSEAERLAEAAPQASRQLMMLRNGTHTFGTKHPWDGPTAEYDLAASATVDWLGKALAGAGDK
ncbi:MAG: alpha/beta hydrolase [Elusimicrobia bacterium]|nr:alpha/beta hydrolase [Elusimicrobiota bacterium]